MVAVFVVALVLRLAIVWLGSDYFSSRGFVLDDETYDFMATDMAAGATERWDAFTHSLYWRTAAFLGPVTLIYKLFGPDKPIAQMFVALLGAGAAALVVKLAAEILSRNWALAAGVALAVLPSQAFWSSMLMKDAAVWVTLIGLGVVVAVAGRSNGKKLLLCGLAAIVLMSALAFLREHTLVVASWAVAAAAFFGSRIQRAQRIAGALLIALCVPWFVGQIGPAGLGLVTSAGSLAERRFLNAVGANTAIVEAGNAEEIAQLQEEFALLTAQASEVQEELTKPMGEPAGPAGGAAQPDDGVPPGARRERLRRKLAQIERRSADVSHELSTLSAPPPAPPGSGLLDPTIRHIPRGLSVMLFEPFPVPFTGSLSLRLARLESLLWYPLLVLASVGLWRARRYLRVLAFPLIAGGGIMLTYAMAEGNVGTAHRHRGEFVWVVALLAAVGLAHLVRSRRRVNGLS